MNKQEEMIDSLNELIHVCRDSEQGLRQAAKEIHDAEQKKMLATAARLRAEFAQRIQDELCEMGVEPADAGTLAGLCHRSWMNLRYQLNLHDDEVVFRECCRGEEAALTEYEELIEKKSLKLDPVLENLFVNIIEMRNKLAEIVADKTKVKETGEGKGIFVL